MFQHLFPALDIRTVCTERHSPGLSAVRSHYGLFCDCDHPLLSPLPCSLAQARAEACKRVVLLNRDPEADAIEMRHYHIKMRPVGLSRVCQPARAVVGGRAE